MAHLKQNSNETHNKHSTYAALHNPNFRLYFAGQVVSVSGLWMQNIALGFLVFNLTRSELWLGFMALAAGIPMILLLPIAGVVVENMPRRQLLIITQTIQMLLALMLAILVFTSLIQTWHIILLAFCSGLINALDKPARQTFVVEVVGREDLASGITLNSILSSGARVLGPALAGMVLVNLGAAWCFLINAATFCVALFSLFVMDVPFSIESKKKKASSLQQLKDGLTFARENSIVAPLLLLTCLIGLLVAPIINLFPAFADLALHSPKEGYAAISAAQGSGAIIGGIIITWLGHHLGYGRLIASVVILSSLSLVLLAFQTVVWLAAVVAGLSGLFLFLQSVSGNTLIQMTVSDEFRGRVMSLYALAIVGIAPFGALVLGILASMIGTAAAIGTYGVLSGIGGGLIILHWPHLLMQKRVP